MNKKIINFVATIIIALILSQFLAWWSIMLAAIITAILIPLKKAAVFIVPSLAVALLWIVQSWLLSSTNDYILAKKIAFLLPLGRKSLCANVSHRNNWRISCRCCRYFWVNNAMFYLERKVINMITKLNLENILFLDIETVPEVQHFSELAAPKQELWKLKSQYQRKDDFTAEEFYERAGIWAEFGKIICISVGYFSL